MTDHKKIFREKVNQVSVQPSSAAWEKLSNKLDGSNKAKPAVKYFKLLAVAASLTLLIGLLWHNEAFSKADKIASATTTKNAANKSTAASKDVNSTGAKITSTQTLPQNPYETFYQKVIEARRNGLLERY